MATIPSGSKFFSQAESVDTTYGGPASLKAESAWFTIEDIASSVTGVPTLDFTWSKDESYNSARIAGTVYTLGISTNNLTLDPSKTYNLLIKRWRYAERVGFDEITEEEIFRTAGYKHEKDADALLNNRANKIPIVTTDLTYYDFNQDFYFKEIIEGESGSESIYATGTGKKQAGGAQRIGWISLAFDLEITNEDDTKTVIENIGKLSMVSNAMQIGEEAYIRTISYNKMT
jgi:hypothetical protein